MLRGPYHVTNDRDRRRAKENQFSDQDKIVDDLTFAILDKSRHDRGPFSVAPGARMSTPRRAWVAFSFRVFPVITRTGVGAERKDMALRDNPKIVCFHVPLRGRDGNQRQRSALERGTCQRSMSAGGSVMNGC